MNAVLPRPALPVHAHTLAVWRAQPSALMLLGRVPSPMPKTGSARVASSLGGLGVFRAEFWPLAAETGCGFLAIIRLPDHADPSEAAELILRGARNGDRDFRLELRPASTEQDFGRQLATLAGPHAAKLVRFMLDLMQPEDGNDMRRPYAVLQSFLNHAAHHDGCVELVLHVPDRCVLLQGWGTRPSEPVDVLLPGPDVRRHAAQFCEFARNDVQEPATGNVLSLPPDAIRGMGHSDRLFLLTGNHLLSRQIVEQRILDPQESIGQIRHLLPRLSCPTPLGSLLRSILQPRFEGHDTLSGSLKPVRAALDIAVYAEGAGVYLSGWLFDPAGHIAKLDLCWDEAASRIDDALVRVPREDVTAAFRSDPYFPLAVDDDHGFAASVAAAPPPGVSAYLSFTFKDGDLAFLPITLAPISAKAALRKVMQSVDLHKRSGLPIVERHLAPFVARFPAIRTSGALTLRGPIDRARAIVVPLRSSALPRPVISTWLRDPLATDEQIVFVCGPEWQNRTDSLVDLVRFYDLPVSIITLPQTPRSSDAVFEAANFTEASSFLLMSPTAVGMARGWRAELDNVANGSDAACPTILYEDCSLRFAGSNELLFTSRAPFTQTHGRLAGLPASVIDADDIVPIEGGTLSCCLLRRSAIDALLLASTFLTDFGEEAAFFQALRQSGATASWAPTIHVTAPEEDTAETAPIAILIDGWALRHRWNGEQECAS